MTLPEFSSHWGPPKKTSSLSGLGSTPYAPFSKGDKLGKAADWVADPTKDGKDQRSRQGRGFRDPYHAYGSASTTFFASEESDSLVSFNVVESTTKAAPKARSQNAVLKTRGRQNAAQQVQSRQPFQLPTGRQIGQATSLANRDRGNRRGGTWASDKAKVREPSIPIQSSWELIQANTFTELNKLKYSVPMDGKTLKSCGYVYMFDKNMDKSQAAQKLKPVDQMVFNVTTSDDPVISDLIKQKAGKVYITDVILATLMCTTKSNNPWDVIVKKQGDNIIFDKRDDGALDYLSVDENSQNPPFNDAESGIDSTSALSVEATYINQNFVSNVVTTAKHDLGAPNPFASDEEAILAKGYVYREFNLESDPEKEPIPLIVRCEVDAAVKGSEGETGLAIVRALNEYGGQKPLEWRDKFQFHRGAIVAAEMKNNLNKMSQWAIGALLSGAKVIKLGLVSRVNAKNKSQHEIVGVSSFEPSHFARQLGLQLDNSWGIIRSLINIFTSLGDGEYIIMRDPNLQYLRVFRTK